MRQLTSLDAQFLAMENPRIHGHVGGLAIYDPASAPGGAVEIGDVCRLIGERLHLLPPFKWKLAEVPFGLDHPYWIDDPHFSLDFHIRESAVPPPGDDRQLAETVSRIFARPLDRARPLWEFYLIHGLSGGRVATLTKVHHSAVDGMSGAEILSVLLDLSPEGREIPAPSAEVTSTSSDRAPSQLEMLARGIAGIPSQPVRMLKSLPSTVPNITRFPGLGAVPGSVTASRALSKVASRARGTDDGGVLGTAAHRAPKLSFNTRISPHRRFAFGSVPLPTIKRLKNELGITVNDVVVALCATGLRDWLIERDELPEDPLIAMIPVSVRAPEQFGTFGNKVSAMIVPIPTDEADPRKRLMKTHEILRAAKDQHKALPADLMTNASNFIPPALHSRASRVASEVMGRLRPPLNVVISNVPGPPVPLYSAGAELQNNFPVSVITDGVGLNITCLSYLDHVDFGLVGDRESIDDLWSLMDGMSSALEDLEGVICGSPSKLAAARS